VEQISGWILGCSEKVFPDFASLQDFLRGQYLKPRPVEATA
jgi:hypothetical protein